MSDSQITLGHRTFNLSNPATGQSTDMGMIVVAVPDHDVYQMAADEGQGARLHPAL